MEIYGFAPWGYDGHLVRIEIDVRRGIPGIEMVGLPGSSVREARERVRIALRRAGFEVPADRILFNLSPADLPKTGSGYDLPLALALLHGSGQWTPPFDRILALGELALDGTLHGVPGVLAAGQKALAAGMDAFAIPEECRAEGSVVPDLPLASGPDLASLVATLATRPLPLSTPTGASNPQVDVPWGLRGQPLVVRALEVCAAGGHSLLLYGPPGGGKTLAAKALEGLLPPLEPEEALETTRLWSLAGVLPRNQGLLSQRPFRIPHHQASAEGLLGGGRHQGPGEISMAHHGVLFLDEAPEFSARVLQGLREPLEEGAVSVVRAGRSTWFPARFQLILTANACPCGQTGRDHGVCLCSPLEIRRYWDRIGTALLDRVDLRVFVRPEDPETLLEVPPINPEVLRCRIARARRRQRARGQGPLEANAILGPDDLDARTLVGERERRYLADVGQRQDWSSRALHSLLRVGRTLADLDDVDRVEVRHLEAAVGLRRPSGDQYWEL